MTCPLFFDHRGGDITENQFLTRRERCDTRQGHKSQSDKLA